MSDQALQLIAENKQSKDTFLDLGNCGLTEVLAEVGELVWLESLTFARAWHQWDGKAWQRKNRRNLGKANEHLIDIGPSREVSRLRSLVLSNTQLRDLTPLVPRTFLRIYPVSCTNARI